jgi:HEAT repeat protein
MGRTNATPLDLEGASVDCQPGRARAGAVVAALAALLAVLNATVGCGLFRAPPPEPAQPSAALQQRFAEAEGRLHSPDASVRRQAAVALLSLDHPDALQVALDRIRNAQDARVRISLLQAAGHCADGRAFPAVLAAIRDPDPDVQKAAAEALSSFQRPEQVDAMAELLARRDVTDHQKELLLGALGEGLAVRAVPVLLDALEAMEGAPRDAAWQALRRISRRQLPPDPQVWRDWWQVAEHRTRESVLEEHLEALAHDLQARTAELNELQDEQQELMKLVGSVQGESPALLLQALASRHESVRRYAASRLAALGKEKLNGLKLDTADRQVLAAALAEQSVEVRRNVVQFAVQLSADHRDQLIAAALADEDPVVLTTAIDGLRSGGPAVLERLGRLLADSPHARVREAAANALGKVGTAESVPALMKALADPEENVRWFAVEGLRKLGATQAVPVVSEMLRRDASARVREIAASALGELGQPAGVPALSAALGDPNERVRQKAVVALQALATGNYERMSVIAETLREHGQLEPARQVLSRIVEQYGEREEMRNRLTATYERLASIQKELGDPAGAARTYEELDALSGGSEAVRQKLIACWLQAGEPQRVVPAVERWLATAAASDGAEQIEAALALTERLIEEGHTPQAAAVLDLVERAAGETPGEKTAARIAELRGRLAG